MRLLGACSLGGAGHLGPLVPFLDAARAGGHDVAVIAVPEMRDMVERAGHRFHAGGAPSEPAVGPIREQLPVLPRAEAAVLGNRELFGRLATRAMLPAVTDLVERWRPDVILREPCEYASAVVAARYGIPAPQVAISLAAAEWRVVDLVDPVVSRMEPRVTTWLRSSPYLSRFPGSVDRSPFPSTLRYREPAAGAARALPDGWWPGRTGPLVYVTFGTVLGHMSHAAEVYRSVLQAAGQLPARVLLTVGRRFDPVRLGPPPRNVHIEAWVDQADVVGQAELVVCHGGSGTTLGALAAGVPLVVVPLFADQFANARWTARSGAALASAGTDPGQIRDAAAVVLADSRYREAARRVAAEIAAARPVAGVLPTVLSWPAPTSARG